MLNKCHLKPKVWEEQDALVFVLLRLSQRDGPVPLLVRGLGDAHTTELRAAAAHSAGLLFYRHVVLHLLQYVGGQRYLRLGGEEHVGGGLYVKHGRLLLARRIHGHLGKVAPLVLEAAADDLA
jgi:hypothetical protein